MTIWIFALLLWAFVLALAMVVAICGMLGLMLFDALATALQALWRCLRSVLP